LSGLAKYFHTLRYLRPIQVFGRIRFKLIRPRLDRSDAPPLRQPLNRYTPPVSARVSMLGPGRFRLLNLEADCLVAADWQGQGRTQLWAYNLHYFDDLNAADASARGSWHQTLIERWIDENPPGMGIGWDPYPVSRRMVNWIKWSLRGNLLSTRGRQSLAVQARWLARRLEVHLQGNHLFANAKALVYAGLYFEGAEAEDWLRCGLLLMNAQLAEQIMADGGHFERSTMYHAAFAEDLLDTIGILATYGRSVDAGWHSTAGRMLSWLESMSHPDAGIAFFNDAAFGIAPAPAQLRDYAARLNVVLDPAEKPGMHRLMPSGYLSVTMTPFFLVCDVAPIGPDHLPAHAHADTLSFEMSFEARRVFVNSGTSEYGLSAERHRQRGTAAHNTLVLDGENSSEVWAGFRVARRARATLLGARAEDQRFIVAGEHSGYRRLSGRNIHRRTWTLTPQELRIEDTVVGRFGSAGCYFHLHPEIQVQRVNGSDLRLSDSQGLALEMSFAGAVGVDVIDGTWHPEFGAALRNRCVVARLEGSRLVTRIRRSDLN
jgi:uncharacterized heparinase superfamily protein